MCNTKKNLWNGHLPLAPHLWEAWVGFVQCVGARVHCVRQLLLQKTVDGGCVTNPESKNEANEQTASLSTAEFSEV